MSAFIVADATINRVVTQLHFSRERWIKRQLAELGLENDTQIAEAMFKLNVEAVQQRYEDVTDGSEFRPLDFRYTLVLGNVFDGLKALKCWLYQCSEGDIDQRPLYKIMRDFEYSLLMGIVRSLPQWEAADTWH